MVIPLIKLNIYHPDWWKYALVGAAGVGLVVARSYCSRAKRCKSKAQLDGKTVIITGANSGLGLVTAQELAKRNARVILACRDANDAIKASTDIRKRTKEGELIPKELDLASLRSVQRFAEEVLKEEARVDVLINNAGVYRCPLTRTQQGFEMQMGVNHLGHFLLTTLLLDKLKSSTPSRVVIVTSGLSKLGKIDFENLNSEKSYCAAAAYNSSKLANNLFGRELARLTEGSGVGVYCVSPGMVYTQLGRHVFTEMSTLVKILFYPLYWFFTRTPIQGCQTIIYCAVAEELGGITGKFYRDCKEVPWDEKSVNDDLAKELWDISEKLVSGEITVRI